MRFSNPVATVVLLIGLGLVTRAGEAQLPEVLEAGPDPVPVLLVPGWGDDAPDLEPLRTRFVDAGWPTTRVSAVDFDDVFGSNTEHAEEIGAAIRVLRGITGAERVDVVAHSMGGLAVRHYLNQSAAAIEGEPAGPVPVRRAVFLGTPHRGTVAAALAWGDGGREMVPGSGFLDELNDRASVPPEVDALTLSTLIDLRIIPASSAHLSGERVVNLELCCPTHNQLIDHDETFGTILRFLLQGPDAVESSEGVDPPRRE